MTLSISFRFGTVILDFVDGPPNRRDSPFKHLAGKISRLAGVVVNHFKVGQPWSYDWHVIRGGIFSKSPAEMTDLEENFPHHFAAEFISPVYFELNSAGWKDEVSLVFNTVGEFAYWRPDSSFSLRTSVWSGRTEKFTLPQLKRIAMLVCRFEEAIDSLPQARRRLDNSKLVRSNRFDNPAFRNHTLPEIYSLIQAASTISGLCTLINKKHQKENRVQDSSGVYFHKTSKVHFAGDSSIHFFQHENTTSAEASIKWAEFLLRFVEYALSVSEATIVSGGNTIEDLARLVSLP